MGTKLKHLADMQIEHDRLKTENQTLVINIKEKNRKVQQTQELYDRLKRKEMTAATRSAAFDSVDDMLGGPPARQSYQESQDPHSFQTYPPDHSRPERAQTRQVGRTELDHGIGSRMMPPPPRHSTGFQGKMMGFGELRTTNRVLCSANQILGAAAPTPSSHRTQLGSFAQPTGHIASISPRNAPGSVRMPAQNTPSQRQPLKNISPNGSVMRSYGLRGGIKVGRQHQSVKRPSFPIMLRKATHSQCHRFSSKYKPARARSGE